MIQLQVSDLVLAAEKCNALNALHNQVKKSLVMPAPSRTPSQPSSPKPLFVCGLLLSIIAAVMFAIFRTQAKTLPASNALVAVAASTSSATAVAAVSPTVAPVKPEIESPIDYSVSFEVVKVLSHDPASFT